MTRGPANGAYRVKLTLLDTEPPIWRRLLLPGSWHLGQVHHAVQGAMGWEDCHLHEFDVGGQRWGPPDPDRDSGEVRREVVARLHEVVPAAGDTLGYTYDFGDGWRHELLVEELLPPASRAHCLAGRRRCPPEDCGGPGGYTGLLEALADPEHPDHDELREWVGGPLDPEWFDLVAVNRALSRLR